MTERIIRTLEFGGIVQDDEGKMHHVRRSYCDKCGKLRAETHHGCCGFMSNGWVAFEPCVCQKNPAVTQSAGNTETPSPTAVTRDSFIAPSKPAKPRKKQ